jgi:8-oxo-dGTP pyrophosphatase MutT (NUDIX family)
MKKNKPLKREFSAGGVVYRKLKTKNSKLKTEWLICKHSGYKKWVFPKGLIDKGETSEETALREVEEETGVKAKIMEKIPEKITYFYHFGGEKIFKGVVYFLMEYVSGNEKNHDFEMEEVEWVDYNEAKRRLGFESDRKVLEKAKKMIMAH